MGRVTRGPHASGHPALAGAEPKSKVRPAVSPSASGPLPDRMCALGSCRGPLCTAGAEGEAITSVPTSLPGSPGLGAPAAAGNPDWKGALSGGRRFAQGQSCPRSSETPFWDVLGAGSPHHLIFPTGGRARGRQGPATDGCWDFQGTVAVWWPPGALRIFPRQQAAPAERQHQGPGRGCGGHKLTQTGAPLSQVSSGWVWAHPVLRLQDALVRQEAKWLAQRPLCSPQAANMPGL